LSNTDNASIALRRELLESCNLHTILDCPAKTFLGAGVKTIVLFFTKGPPTKKIWYYQLMPGRSLGKTNPLNDNDLKEFIDLQKSHAKSDQSWAVKIDTLDKKTWNLSVNNPNTKESAPLREPKAIIEEMLVLDKENKSLLASIKGLL
ncbi:MAG: N-6 DNA methylase, partial [Gammaproteobacteria bacterium]|nr:N-6 DNA methylase [Gammaproteobacteria bacterium]